MEINKLYQGDSLDLLKKMSDNSVDLVMTSPPYSTLKTYIDNPGIHPDNYVEWFIPICKEISRVLKPTGSFILNINDKVQNGFRHPYVFDLISELHKQTDLKMFERLFWNKLKSLPNRGRFGDRVEYLFWFAKDKNFYFNIDEFRVPYSDVSIKRMKKPLRKRFSRSESTTDSGYKDWEPNPKGALPTSLVNISSESKKIYDKHVAVYPIELAKYFIKGSTKPGDVVLDPFIGTGTTAVACQELGRNWMGFDLQQEYIDFAYSRIENKISYGRTNSI